MNRMRDKSRGKSLLFASEVYITKFISRALNVKIGDVSRETISHLIPYLPIQTSSASYRHLEQIFLSIYFSLTQFTSLSHMYKTHTH